MGKILTLSSRPKKLSELVGQKQITESIKSMVAADRIPNCFMFSGNTGSGKTTVARILAVSFQCKHAEFGEPCEQCYRSKNRYQITEINASELSGVNEISDVVQNSNHMPLSPSSKRVYVLDEAQRLSSAAQNLLLKYFEDTPPTTVWMICTTEPNKILPTLRRRCMQYTLKPLSIKGIETLVNRIKKKVDLKFNVDNFVEAALEKGVTSPALLIMAIEKHVSGMSLDASLLGVESEVDTLGVCRAVARGELQQLHTLLKKATPEDARFVRASVVGYLNSMLANKTDAAETITTGILQLAEVARFDESLQMAATKAILHRLCYRFKRQ